MAVRPTILYGMEAVEITKKTGEGARGGGVKGAAIFLGNDEDGQDQK